MNRDFWITVALACGVQVTALTTITHLVTSNIH